MEIKLPKLLCVDDEPSITSSISRLFRNEFNVYTAHSAEEGLEAVQNHKNLSIIISDYRLPRMQGVEFLSIVKKISPLTIRTILSGQIDLTEVSSAINNQIIHRLFLKPWENEYLKIQMKESLLSHQMLVDKAHYQQMSITDPLTGLYNHRHFQEVIREKINLTKNSDTKLCLVMMDIDNFKYINDTFGHLAGDKILQQVSSNLTRLLNTASLFRYGGEEFAGLFENFNSKNVVNKLNEARTQMSKMSYIATDDTQISVELSFGVSELSPQHNFSSSLLIQSADQALLKAKSLGKNQIQTSV